MIFIDPSESRKGTRLPDAIIRQATELPGLEEKTGADLLLSPLSGPATSEYLLGRHCQAGILVQRKSGLDIASSIVDGRITNAIERMYGKTPYPWLVVIARIERRADGVSTIDGRTSLHYSAIQGALDKWQMRGGFVSVLDNDAAFVAWIAGKLDFLRAPDAKRDKAVIQHVVGPDPLLNCLCTFPGLGETRARAILDGLTQEGGYAPLRTLINALNWLTNPLMELPPGVGEKTRQAVREFVGLDETENCWDVLDVCFCNKKGDTR